MAIPLAIPLAVAAFSAGNNMYQSWRNRRDAKRAKKKRRNFWENEISPLFDGMDQEPMTDEEMDSLRSAEMQMPTLQLQNQMRGLAGFSDTMQSKSGFSGSGFLGQEIDSQMNTMNQQYSNQAFNVDRGIMDMQNQIKSLIDQNNLRRKELEYTYLYG